MLRVEVTHRDRMGNGVPESADADLEGSAVPDQCRRAQRDGVLRRVDDLVGNGEQVAGFVGFDDRGEVRLRQRRIPLHERQGIAGLADQQDFAVQPVAQVQGHVGIARQAAARSPGGVLLSRDQLRDDVDAAGGQVPGGMSVVAADVVLLNAWMTQPGTRAKEEFADLHVVREGSGPQVSHMGMGRDVREQVLLERLEESTFEIRGAARYFQGQCRVDVERRRRVPFRPGVERTDQRFRLSQPERQRQPDIAVQGLEQPVRDLPGVRRGTHGAPASV
ncbi:MAG: hypothetical protein U5R48_14150 [Gammaproteobacteria bacterium]|nr:hypothetical protein [Gammaproteobacteria bacterium]